MLGDGGFDKIKLSSAGLVYKSVSARDAGVSHGSV